MFAQLANKILLRTNKLCDRLGHLQMSQQVLSGTTNEVTTSLKIKIVVLTSCVIAPVKGIGAFVWAFIPDTDHLLPFLIGSNGAQGNASLILCSLEINEHDLLVLLIPYHVPQDWITVEYTKMVNST